MKSFLANVGPDSSQRHQSRLGSMPAAVWLQVKDSRVAALIQKIDWLMVIIDMDGWECTAGCKVQVQWERVMRRLIMMEGDVAEGSTPLKDLFDHLSQGQTRISFAQFKVLYRCCFVLPGQSMQHVHRWKAQHSMYGLNAACLPMFDGTKACLTNVRLFMLVSVFAIENQACSLWAPEHRH